MASSKDAAEKSPFLNGEREAPHCSIVNHTNDEDNQRKVYSFTLSTEVTNDLENGNGHSYSKGDSETINGEGAQGQPQDKKKGCRNYFGILLALFAGFVFTVGTIFAKYMKHYHAFTLAFYRVQGILVPSMFMVLYATKVKKIKVFEPIWPLGEEGKWKIVVRIILRSGVGCTALFLHFYALQYLTVADVAVISSCKPIFVTIAAFFLLGETCGFFPVFMACLTMIGVGVITRPPILTGQDTFDQETLVGAAFAMGSVLTDTFVVIIIRSLKHIHVSVMMLFLGCWGTLQSTLCAYAIGELKLPESGDWPVAIGLAWKSWTTLSCWTVTVVMLVVSTLFSLSTIVTLTFVYMTHQEQELCGNVSYALWDPTSKLAAYSFLSH